MKTKTNFRQEESRRRAVNRFPNHTERHPRPNKFEIQLNVFFYRLFGAISVVILFAAIYAGAWHHLVTAAITAAMAWVIYDENKKHKR